MLNNDTTTDATFRAMLQRLGVKVSENITRTVAELVPCFLAEAAERVAPLCLRDYRYYLTPFVERFGSETLPLRPESVEAWSRRPSWSQSTRHNALKTVTMLCRWAGHPIRLRIPAKTSAGSKMVLTAPQFFKLLGYSKGDFREIIKLLWYTGCRPSEATRLHVSDIDLNSSCARLADHKTVSKTGKSRTIYLCEEALDVCRLQIKKYRSGPLFRGQYSGRAFTRHGLVCQFQHLSERSGVKATAYCFRHSFASRALAQGIPDAHVAALLGHCNTAMVHRHYAHLSEQSRVLKDAAERIQDV